MRPASDADAAPARRPTRAVVLELIRVAGPISRIELAEATALTPATMTTVVRDLIADGLVVETGVGEPTGGKRRTLLEARPDSRYAIGVVLGFAGTSYVVVNAWGELVAERPGPGADRLEPAEVVRRIAGEVDSIIAETGIDREIVAGVGMVVPGPIDIASGAAVQLPSSLPWSDFSVRDALARALSLPVVMENDATAAAAGEYWSRATGGQGTFATIHMGIGIGAGIMIAGELLRGISGNAGEIGHVSIDLDGPRCHCGNRGCLELFAAPPAAEERYLALTGVRRGWAEIAARANAGDDPDAMMTVGRSAEALAVAVTSLVNLLDLDLVVLTGAGFAGTAPAFAERIGSALAERFFVRRSHPVRVVAAADPDRSAALGGAAIVLREYLASPRPPL
ncbi:ROK family transcriptional regulator [Microbacterium sp. XT11]|uniref:ROK family transcriptional regulator n=1 Tax=Microbacterium sp. XT11 TaxID=367477 RepID=UPI000743066D|nr:ROK family transcriptional regulator [Microbacterium sp. XT11]ALX65770.1 ROK family transcriptional regulator [Microbacterium sp. XT11]